MLSVSVQPALEPVSVALKLAFLAVLYLFILWVARGALKDLRQDSVVQAESWAGEEATASHAASAGLGVPAAETAGRPRLEVLEGPGLQAGNSYELMGTTLVGRDVTVDIRVDDPFVSSSHLEIAVDGGLVTAKDLGSTNGTYLNGDHLVGVVPLHDGDRIKVGSAEFEYRK